jgi:hypothetical protein
MKRCTLCGQEIHNEQANGDLLSPLGLGTRTAMGNGSTGGSPPASNGSNSKGNGGNRRSRLGPDWQPTQAQRAYCERQGKDPDSFLQAFKGYYEAKGTQWLNWGKVWEKACRDWKGHPEAQKAPLVRESLKDKELNLWRQRLSSKVWNGFWGPKVGEPGCMVPKELIDV